MWITWAGGNAVKARVWGEFSFTHWNHHTVLVEHLETAKQMLGEPRSIWSGSEFVVSDLDVMLQVGPTREQAALLVVGMDIMEVEQLAGLKKGDVKKVAELVGESDEVVKAWVGSAKALLSAERIEVPGVVEETKPGG